MIFPRAGSFRAVYSFSGSASNAMLNLFAYASAVEPLQPWMRSQENVSSRPPPMLHVSFSTVTVPRLMHSENAPFPISVTLSGIVTAVSAPQPPTTKNDASYGFSLLLSNQIVMSSDDEKTVFFRYKISITASFSICKRKQNRIECEAEGNLLFSPDISHSLLFLYPFKYAV